MLNRATRGRLLGPAVSPVRTPASGATVAAAGTYLIGNSTADLETVYQLANVGVGLEFEFIVSAFTTSTAGASCKVKAPAGMSFKAATDQDVLVFDAADEAVTVRSLSATRLGIMSNVGSVTSSSST